MMLLQEFYLCLAQFVGVVVFTHYGFGFPIWWNCRLCFRVLVVLDADRFDVLFFELVREL